MAEVARKLKINKTNVDTKCVPHAERAQVIYWDEKFSGFGVVVGKKAKTYIVQRDVSGRTRRVKIGRHGDWTPEEARKRARELLVELDQGKDPTAEKRKRAARGVTLRQALEEHLSRLRAARS